MNRTGRIPPIPEETDTETMWGVPCCKCYDGWLEGCGRHGCKTVKPIGMAVNGACQCGRR